MSELRFIEKGDPEEANDEAKALEAARTLESHYPNHPWLIAFQGGSLVVRHLAVSDAVREEIGRDGFGFVIPPHKFKSCTAKELAHTAMLAGGQMLEAFGLKRGGWHGEEPKVPAAWKYKQDRSFQ